MSDSIKCPQCGKTYRFQAELAGKQVRCMQCKSTFPVAPPLSSDFVDILDEELTAAAVAAEAARKAKADEQARNERAAVEAAARKKARRAADRAAKKEKRKLKRSQRLGLGGTGTILILIVITQWSFLFHDKPMGPYSVGFRVLMLGIGIALIVAGAVKSK